MRHAGMRREGQREHVLKNLKSNHIFNADIFNVNVEIQTGVDVTLHVFYIAFRE